MRRILNSALPIAAAVFISCPAFAQSNAPQASPPAQCANADALGVTRVVEIDTTGGPPETVLRQPGHRSVGLPQFVDRRADPAEL